MDENGTHLQSLLRHFGYSEKEAYAAYYLDQAFAWFEELLAERLAGEPYASLPDLEAIGERGRAKVSWETDVNMHFRALHSVLARGILQRDYPAGWGMEPSSGEDE